MMKLTLFLFMIVLFCSCVPKYPVLKLHQTNIEDDYIEKNYNTVYPFLLDKKTYQQLEKMKEFRFPFEENRYIGFAVYTKNRYLDIHQKRMRYELFDNDGNFLLQEVIEYYMEDPDRPTISDKSFIYIWFIKSNKPLVRENFQANELPVFFKVSFYNDDHYLLYSVVE